jgi:hypothetical protein
MWFEMLFKKKGVTIEKVVPIKQYPSIKYKASINIPYEDGIILEVSGEDRFQTELLLADLMNKIQGLGGAFDNTKN